MRRLINSCGCFGDPFRIWFGDKVLTHWKFCIINDWYHDKSMIKHQSLSAINHINSKNGKKKRFN